MANEEKIMELLKEISASQKIIAQDIAESIKLQRLESERRKKYIRFVVIPTTILLISYSLYLGFKWKMF